MTDGMEWALFIDRGLYVLEEHIFTFSPDGEHEYRITKLRRADPDGENGSAIHPWEEWYAEVLSGDDYEEYWDAIGEYDRVRQRPQMWPTIDEAITACIDHCETNYA